ncbi:MAG: anthranilate phosphoribosyltransferase, partial [Thermoanaerobaculia bacterium]|nr:anthranilate phosphoribosyltransferase [Thermoanaerobaculia bacterium]
RQLLGVYARDKVPLLAQVLAELGSQHALIVHGADGLDEISVTGPTWVAEVREGVVTEFTLTPEEFGIERTSLEALRGGSPEENAEALEALLNGATGAYHDIVSLNAGAALYVAGEVDSIGGGVIRARTTLRDGRAAQKLNQLREATNR